MFFFLSLWYIMYTQNKNNKQKKIIDNKIVFEINKKTKKKKTGRKKNADADVAILINYR